MADNTIMKTISANIPTSLGDIINIKSYLDLRKSEYDQINLTFHKSLWDTHLNLDKTKTDQWNNYLNDIGNLFFSEKPYTLNKGQYPFYDTIQLVKVFGLNPNKPELSELLCKGIPLDIKDYIVLTTKIRGIDMHLFYSKCSELMRSLNQLSKKYKIVILGERITEERKEYKNIPNTVFSIYDVLINNLFKDNVIDLTIPALGNTQSTLKQIQQDCLIMHNAITTITLGIGGNFGMSSAVSKYALGWRQDDIWLANIIWNKGVYSNAFITKDFDKFITKINNL